MPRLQELYKLIARLSKRERTILYFALFFVLLFLLNNFLIYPVYSKISSLNNAIREKEQEIRTSLRVLSQKEKILSEGRRYASFMRRPQTDEEGMIALLKLVERLANKSSLYVIDMKPGGVKEDKDKTKKYLVNLTAEGQMEQIMEFMYNVENAEELLIIEKFQISPKSRESSIAECAIVVSKLVI